jgi:hypothetical protein
MSWCKNACHVGMNQTHDSCSPLIISFGLNSAHGNISIGAPLVNGNPSDSWCVSSAMTASKLIAILSLSKTIASVQNLDVDMDTWSQGYCRAVQDTVGSKFCPSSLSFLAKYWQDPQGKLSSSCSHHTCLF